MNPAAAPVEPESGKETASAGKDKPWLFALMIAPTGALANGVVQGGALAYLLSKQGVGSGGQSHLLALLGIPTWLYFVWSPITDFFVRRRTWLLIGGVSAGAMIAAAFHEQHLTSRSAVALMLLSACLVQLVVSSCGGIMAELHSEKTRKRASGFYQAGLSGFGSLSAWALVYMSSRVSQGTLGWFAGMMIALPALSVLAAPAQQRLGNGSFTQSLRNVAVEFKHTFWARRAVPYLLYMLLPGCTGAAVGLLPGIAAQYRVSGDSVAWVNGLAGGLLLAAGALSFAAVPTLNSLGNVPVQYMILADGWGADRFGVKGLTGTECVIGVVACSAFLAWLYFRPALPTNRG